MNKILIPILLIISSVVIYNKFIVSGFEDIKQVREEQSVLRDILSNKKEELENTLYSLNNVISKIDQKDINKLNRILPNEDNFDQIAFINDISSMAINRGLVLETVSFAVLDEEKKGRQQEGEEQKDTQLGKFFIEFNTVATYGDFVLFLQDIEKNERISDVDLTTIQVSDTDRFNFIVKLITYWSK